MGTETGLAVRVQRAIEELRRGHGVVVENDLSRDVVYGLEVAPLESLLNNVAENNQELHLVITRERAVAVGHTPPPGVETMCYRWNSKDDIDWVKALALQAPANNLNGAAKDLFPGDAYLSCGVKLVKLAKLMPAMAVVRIPMDSTAEQNAISPGAQVWCSLDVSDINSYDALRAKGLTISARADIPLRGKIQSEFVVFRDQAGCDDYVAIVIAGEAQSDAPLVRLHSACFTGDLFGSLRCDCGSQLQQSIDAIANGGGGVLLYLAQEGRGIGLTNKLRAYAIQDHGFDTMEADGHLGFKPDERTYEAAARMLCELGMTRIRLLTNSPQKISALQREGIVVVDRVALTTIPNPHNTPYLKAKADKAGHWLEDVF